MIILTTAIYQYAILSTLLELFSEGVIRKKKHHIYSIEFTLCELYNSDEQKHIE